MAIRRRDWVMVKFENIWLFERSEFQRFSNFIIVQSIAEIKPKFYFKIIYEDSNGFQK